MKDYVVTYHPEGWRSAKREFPERKGYYWCADANKQITFEAYFFDGEWYDRVTVTPIAVTHWQPFPPEPWEIMPK